MNEGMIYQWLACINAIIAALIILTSIYYLLRMNNTSAHWRPIIVAHIMAGASSLVVYVYTILFSQSEGTLLLSRVVAMIVLLSLLGGTITGILGRYKPLAASDEDREVLRLLSNIHRAVINNCDDCDNPQ